VFMTVDAVEASFGIAESGDAPPLADNASCHWPRHARRDGASVVSLDLEESSPVQRQSLTTATL
jgi:hypothetical protein